MITTMGMIQPDDRRVASRMRRIRITPNTLSHMFRSDGSVDEVLEIYEHVPDAGRARKARTRSIT